jgi:Ca2+-binding EF-hand superfamily protein
VFELSPLLTPVNLVAEDSQHLSSFAKADVNGDGKISLDELKLITQTNHQIHRGMQAFDSSWTADSTASIIMTAADTNKDGSLSQAEYMSAVAKSQSGTHDLIDVQAVNVQRRALGQPEKRE